MLDLKSLKILEVGSGFGFFLDVYEEFGITTEGCDISERAVTYANQERERVRLGTLDYYYENETLDAVFAFNLIEHLTHPKHFFIQTRRVLKSGGLLVLETPIQESLACKLIRIIYLLSNKKLNFLHLVVSPGGHIYIFSKRTIKYICDDMGFRNLYQKNINTPFGEVWGKSSITSMNYKSLFRFSLLIIWPISKIMAQENRLFIILHASVYIVKTFWIFGERWLRS